MAETIIFHVGDQVFADRGNMPVRPPGDYDHVICKRRLTGNVY
jgi:hypothetical protein